MVGELGGGVGIAIGIGVGFTGAASFLFSGRGARSRREPIDGSITTETKGSGSGGDGGAGAYCAAAFAFAWDVCMKRASRPSFSLARRTGADGGVPQLAAPFADVDVRLGAEARLSFGFGGTPSVSLGCCLRHRLQKIQRCFEESTALHPGCLHRRTSGTWGAGFGASPSPAASGGEFEPVREDALGRRIVSGFLFLTRGAIGTGGGNGGREDMGVVVVNIGTIWTGGRCTKGDGSSKGSPIPRGCEMCRNSNQ